jgi:hypothetical protein
MILKMVCNNQNRIPVYSMLFSFAKHIALQNKIKADKTTDEQAFGYVFLRSAASFVFIP